MIFGLRVQIRERCKTLDLRWNRAREGVLDEVSVKTKEVAQRRRLWTGQPKRGRCDGVFA